MLIEKTWAVAGVGCLLFCVAAISSCGGDDFTSDDGGDGGASDGGSGGGGGSTTASSSGGAGGAAPACEPVGEGACAECNLNLCTDVACACWEAPACLALFQCIGGACDEGCLKSCMSEHPNGISLTLLVTDCSAAHCSVPCGSSPGDPLDECEKCTYLECSKEMNTCLGNSACFDLFRCLRNCPDGNQPCVDDCALAAGPDATEQLETAVECALMACPTCG